MLFFVNQSGKIQTNLWNIIQRANGFYMKGASAGFNLWDFKINIWSWFCWLTPFLGPVIAFLLLLIFGPYIFNLFVKFVSSRIQQINLQMVRRQEYQPVNTRTALAQAAINVPWSLRPLSRNTLTEGRHQEPRAPMTPLPSRK